MYKTPDKVLNVLILYQTAQDVPVLSQTLGNLSCVCLTGGALIHGFPWIIISGNFLKVSKKSIQLSDHYLNVVTALIHA